MERKYQLTRITAGDYIFPSNDGQTLLRVSSYIEDGSASVSADGQNWHKLTGTFWAAKRFSGTVEEADKWLRTDPDILLGWDEWREIEYGMKTRTEAIASALKHTEVAMMREP